jgi:hypothetical protein
MNSDFIFVWQTPGPDIEPKLTLLRWQVIELRGERCAIGYCKERAEGRVSTQIEGFDVDRMYFRTESGRLIPVGRPART